MSSKTTPVLIAIDDEQFYLEEIKMELLGHNVEYRPFVGPSAFEEDAREDDITRAKLILVDYDFRSCTALDRDLGGYIREKYPLFKGKIVLWSLLGEDLKNDAAIQRSFDAVLCKKNLSWDQLQMYMN